MHAKVNTCAVIGLEGAVVEVEVDISPGLPAFTIVGLPDTAVQEARERVRASIRNSGCEFPMRRITVNLAAHLRGDQLLSPYHRSTDQLSPAEPNYDGVDLSHIRGQEHAKRALEVATAGGHNLLLTGPPGSGKTLLARSIPSVLPPLSPEESLEVTKIYSVTGLLPSDTPLIVQPPFRSPHYTISHAGLVGGGRWPHPGEITLSHQGVLFLDELPEFGHSVLEVLRQPMEDKVVTISRAQGTLTFPANFMLAAAMNPCPCGYHGDPQKSCTCTPGMVTRYQKRISGPLLDRIDMFVEVPRVEYEKLVAAPSAEGSEAVRQRVKEAREVQQRRFQGMGMACNADMGPQEVWHFCPLTEGTRGLLQAAMRQLGLSARAFHRVLKLSRTIADLGGSEGIGAVHLAEALQYRPRETAG